MGGVTCCNLATTLLGTYWRTNLIWLTTMKCSQFPACMSQYGSFTRIDRDEILVSSIVVGALIIVEKDCKCLANLLSRISESSKKIS